MEPLCEERSIPFPPRFGEGPFADPGAFVNAAGRYSQNDLYKERYTRERKFVDPS